jgi:uncharacterized C2H2 Zn-finger protein
MLINPELTPNPQKIKTQVEKKEDVLYKCRECGKVFPSKDIKVEKLPENFTVFGLGGDQVPKCPHCDALHWFGFNQAEVQDVDV